MNNIHIVKKGDTLWKISRHYNIKIHDLVEWNNLYGRKKHIIYPNQKIYLSDVEREDEPDTVLSISILDLGFHPIKHAKLILEYDDKKHNVTCDAHGHISDIEIMYHDKGLKVYFQKYDKSYTLIAHHKRVPIGRKKLTLTSRTLKIKGTTLAKKGAQHNTIKAIKEEIKKKNQSIITPTSSHQNNHSHNETKPATTNSHSDTSTTGHTISNSHDHKVKSSKVEHQQTSPHSAENTSQHLDNPPADSTLTKSAEVVRTEGGKPTYNVAEVFTEKNLRLPPGNDIYKNYIITAAKKYDFTPQTLAAMINAEAAKKNGVWNPNSKAPRGSASGMTQALDRTWYEVSEGGNEAYNKSLIHQKASKEHLTKSQLKALKNNPELSIDFAVAYARSNITKLSNKIDKVNQLSPEDLAKIAYLSHHEGPGTDYKFIMGTAKSTWELLYNQIDKRVSYYQKLFPNDATNAYRYWLLHDYIDKQIDVTHFMIDKKGIQPKTMEEIVIFLGGKPLVYPKGQSAPKPHSTNETSIVAPKKPEVVPVSKPSPQVDTIAKNQPNLSSATSRWHDPLDKCIIRTAKLSSPRQATFGMVRKNGKKPHQGVDFEASPGTPIKAVADGRIVAIDESYNDFGEASFGAFVILQCQIDDLPEPQKSYARKHLNKEYVWFFYAHLSQIDSKLKQFPDVSAGQVLGKTGYSGNAGKYDMKTIPKGSHLHFEVRTLGAKRIQRGLHDRFDPLPFFPHIKQP